MEAVWCSFCQKPRFEDDVFNDICICVPFSPVTEELLPQAVASSTFENHPARQYNAVDTWLHGSVDYGVGQIPQMGAFDAMIGISPVATRLGIDTLLREEASSPSTSVTDMTRGTSAQSTRSTSPSCDLANLDVDISDAAEFRRMLNAKQVS